MKKATYEKMQVLICGSTQKVQKKDAHSNQLFSIGLDAFKHYALICPGFKSSL